jgi:hypothetical protein
VRQYHINNDDELREWVVRSTFDLLETQRDVAVADAVRKLAIQFGLHYGQDWTELLIHVERILAVVCQQVQEDTF